MSPGRYCQISPGDGGWCADCPWSSATTLIYAHSVDYGKFLAISKCLGTLHITEKGFAVKYYVYSKMSHELVD